MEALRPSTLWGTVSRMNAMDAVVADADCCGGRGRRGGGVGDGNRARLELCANRLVVIAGQRT